MTNTSQRYLKIFGGIRAPIVEAVAATLVWMLVPFAFGSESPDLSRNDRLVLPEQAEVTDADRKFWSFRPIQEDEPPAVRNQTWPRGAIDRFILAKLEEQRLTPSRDSDKLILLRRLTFDLIGLPPAPEDMEAFACDHSPEAVERVVDRLLGSRQFGERWGRHWLDVA